MKCTPNLTHSYLEAHKRVMANNADPDQTPHNVASDQGLHCFRYEFSIKNRVKGKKGKGRN